MRDGEREGKLFKFQFEAVILQQEISHELAVFGVLNTAGAVADFAPWFYSAKADGGTEQLALCFV